MEITQAREREAEEIMSSNTPYSDYIVYIDESGDHSLISVNSDYPIFSLACCVFNKKKYAKSIAPNLTQFKFQCFGHDMVILHEHDIRKEKNGFNFKNRVDKQAFMAKLGDLIHQQTFVILSAVIDKKALAAQYPQPDNPYHIALTLCLEGLYKFLAEREQHKLKTHIVVENRGKKEDNELKIAFQQACDGNNQLKCPLPFKAIFADKKTNSPGLQIADLIARPIGLHVLRPEQNNQAFNCVKNKLYQHGGLQRFPKPH